MPKVYVAMSGGVDSSVAAALLQQRGFKVVGVYFKPWAPNSQGSTLKGSQGRTLSYCNWQEERQSALRAAAAIGIPFKTWDFSREYGRKVAHYMVDGYRRGLTPNPDVMCNREIKFGLFLKQALAEGADYIATGHYVRSEKRKAKSAKPEYKLLKAKDKNKDQSYFLWTLTQDQLKYCLFPIGGYTKPQVRQLAKKFGLPNWNKPDSQGVCFVGPLDVKDFLQTQIKPKPGEIRLMSTSDVDREVVGRHDGAYYYTIGQRHGLDIKRGDGPYFVAAKDVKKNIIYVTRQEEKLGGREAAVTGLNWLVDHALPLAAAVKIRYRTKAVPARLCLRQTQAGKPAGSLKTVLIKFNQPARAIAPGQSAVFYRGQQVLGGGVIQ